MGGQVKIPGEKITLAGRTFVAPPIPLGCMRKYEDVFNGKADPSPLVMGDVIFMTLRRNYPDLTQDEMDELLDAKNMVEVFAAIGHASGLQEAQPGEA